MTAQTYMNLEDDNEVYGGKGKQYLRVYYTPCAVSQKQITDRTFRKTLRRKRKIAFSD